MTSLPASYSVYVGGGTCRILRYLDELHSTVKQTHFILTLMEFCVELLFCLETIMLLLTSLILLSAYITMYRSICYNNNQPL